MLFFCSMSNIYRTHRQHNFHNLIQLFFPLITHTCITHHITHHTYTPTHSQCTQMFRRSRSDSTICEQFLFTSTAYHWIGHDPPNVHLNTNANRTDHTHLRQPHSAKWIFGVESRLRNASTRATGQRCDALVSP